jgi:hypothetical protein
MFFTGYNDPNLSTSSSSSSSLNLSKIINIMSSKEMDNDSTNHNIKPTAHNVLLIKTKLINDLTRAIQSVQKYYLESNQNKKENEPLTNSDYQVHELCQQFDYAFLFGLVDSFIIPIGSFKILNNFFFKIKNFRRRLLEVDQ